ncbi:aromatic ring-hydroxylating dioxygenase subunit alpha [soil metagenome]
MEIENQVLVKNVWYMAAWAHEVTDKPLARRIVDVALVFFRTPAGELSALEDRCCHRGLPLSMGKLVGNALQCGYHGLCFDSRGQCVAVPGQDTIPINAKVRSYPVFEQDAVVWIWMGDPALADPASIVRFERHNDPHWNWRGERFSYRANHHLLYDNLLDLTHVGLVHPNTIGGSAAEHSGAEMRVERDGMSVKGVRWMRNVDPPPAYRAIKPFPGRVDRWQVIRFKPGCVQISAGAKDVGTVRDENDYDEAYETHGFNGVTPETLDTCHYFWSVGIPSRLDRPGLIVEKMRLASLTFEEDRAVLEDQYRNQMDHPGRGFVDLRADGLGLAARRVWKELARRESTESVS